MKLIRHGAPGQERPGLVDADGTLRDLSAHLDDIAGEALDPTALKRLHAIDPETLPKLPSDVHLGPPVGGIGKIVCVGLNYTDHAEELGLPIPDDPVIFLKATSALAGPHDPIVIPRGGTRVDWEVELAIVIGTAAKSVSRDAAMQHVAGYAVFNDVTERAFQFDRGGQWTKGKSCDSFAPLGPWLVTRDEIPDPQALDLTLTVGGKPKQRGSTRHMIFDVAEIVSRLSHYMSFQPGDVIATGTPPGVGIGLKPPCFLTEGDEVVAEITGLGRQVKRVTLDR
jgi:2-keto-4-pentenoate hydratase/2-oxohepta-3-ene-1,7-dioic acid hydratase in catechol pathway